MIKLPEDYTPKPNDYLYCKFDLRKSVSTPFDSILNPTIISNFKSELRSRIKANYGLDATIVNLAYDVDSQNSNILHIRTHILFSNPTYQVGIIQIGLGAIVALALMAVIAIGIAIIATEIYKAIPSPDLTNILYLGTAGLFIFALASLVKEVKPSHT